MNKEIIFLVEESAEGGYEAKALQHSIYTEAEDLEELRGTVKKGELERAAIWAKGIIESKK